MDIFIVKKMGSSLGHFFEGKDKKTPVELGGGPPAPGLPVPPPPLPVPPAPLAQRLALAIPAGVASPAALCRDNKASRSGQGGLRCQIEALWSCTPCLSSFELGGLGLPRRKRDYITQSTGLRRVILTKARLGIPLLGVYPISTLTWRQLTLESWDAGGYLRLGEDLADFPPNLLENENASQSCSSWGSSYGVII
jgi:hypothetical protein